MTYLTSSPAPVLLNAEDAAKALSVSPRTLRRLARRGLLPVVHMGPRAVRCDPQDFPGLIDKLKVGPENGGEKKLKTAADYNCNTKGERVSSPV